MALPAYAPVSRAPRAAPATPCGEGEYSVGEAECLNSIANKFGFLPDTLWRHPKNADLRVARKDHNILMPEDRLYVPELTRREESCATDQRHHFRRKGVPSKVKIRLLDHDLPDPYAGKPYKLDADGTIREGKVDSDGYVQEPVDPGASCVTLTVGEGPEAEIFTLKMSALDPINSVRGAQQRLRNLGLLMLSEPSNNWTVEAIEALKRFQSAYVLENDDEPPSGEFDEPTRSKLREIYGC